MSDSRSEAEIINACKQGDREAFHSLFETHKDRVYSIAFHYSGNEAMAHDVTQQVFLKLFTSINQFHENSQFTTWLYRIVANACTDEHRKRRRFVPFSPEIEVRTMVGKSSQEETYHRRQVADSVRGAIGELAPKLRLPILLKYVEGLSYDGSHPCQKAWVELGVPQCGFCQPGQIMSAAALLAANPHPDDTQIDAAMRGNICRCGTYPRIREAIHKAAGDTTS